MNIDFTTTIGEARKFDCFNRKGDMITIEASSVKSAILTAKKFQNPERFGKFGAVKQVYDIQNDKLFIVSGITKCIEI